MQSSLLSHDLHQEFPDLSDRVTLLKTSNLHFSHLFDDYNAVDKEITKVEEGLVTMDDFPLEDLKKKRLILKDQLYQMLKAA